MPSKPCSRCREVFTYPAKRGRPPTRCSSCRPQKGSASPGPENLRASKPQVHTPTTPRKKKPPQEKITGVYIGEYGDCLCGARTLIIDLLLGAVCEKCAEKKDKKKIYKANQRAAGRARADALIKRLKYEA